MRPSGSAGAFTVKGKFILLVDSSRSDEEVKRTIAHELVHAKLFDSGVVPF